MDISCPPIASRSSVGLCRAKKAVLAGILALLISACNTDTPSIQDWHHYLDVPQEYAFDHKSELVSSYSFDEIDVELLIQANGPGTCQRVIKVFPKEYDGKIPAVVVPFYYPEKMIGFELESEDNIPDSAGIEMMLHLARRGIAAISADSYHLTYINSDHDRDDFSRWKDAGETLCHDYPQWSPMGKLVADTRLLIDLMEEDDRIDSDKIGIAGHSLGGKMAFYTGCLDPRVKVILCSDFGFLWEQSNWENCWYWGEKLEELKTKGMDHTDLLSHSGGKPMLLIAGQYDDDTSFRAMVRAKGYRRHPEKLVIINHASGHRPPMWALDRGYDFLEKWL